MTKGPIKNMAASVRQRLLNVGQRWTTTGCFLTLPA